LKMFLCGRARKAEYLAGKSNPARGSLKEVSPTQKTFRNRQILRSTNKRSFNLGCSFKMIIVLTPMKVQAFTPPCVQLTRLNAASFAIGRARLQTIFLSISENFTFSNTDIDRIAHSMYLCSQCCREE
jgi:hypothetical protein